MKEANKALKLLSFGLAMMLFPYLDAEAESIPRDLREDYDECLARFGVAGEEASGAPVFEGDRLRALPSPRSIDQLIAVEIGECLAELSGNLWAFDPERNRFSTGTFYQQALNAQGRMFKDMEAAQAEKTLRAAELEQAALQARVRSATLEACFILFDESAVQALTNPVCNPVFMEVGLPDE